MNEPNDRNADNKRIFISYSYADHKFAEQLAKSLHKCGEDVWWDKWEILAGDSLIDKIFEQGLAKASAFVVVISPNSVNSKWVREELDIATVRKIDGIAKVIPVILNDVEIPISLRALVWVDMRDNFDEGVKKIIGSVHSITDEPGKPKQESIASALAQNVSDLSRGASSVGLYILRMSDPDNANITAFSGPDLRKALELPPQAINDAIDELEEAGLIRTMKALATAPYQFVQVEPTYVLYREFSEYLQYNPEQDVKITAAMIASAGSITNKELAEKTSLSPGRLNRAVEYLADYGIIDRRQPIGTFPFSFSSVSATARTHQFAGS